MRSSRIVPLLFAAALWLTPHAVRSQARPEADAAPALQTADPAAAAPKPSKIYVASNGSDANDGSRAKPKRNFQAAHDAVAANGHIVAIDTGSYGALQITKSVAVSAAPGASASVTVAGSNNGIRITSGAGSTVSLRGLIIEGGGSRQSTGSGPGFGIYVGSVGHLSLEDCTIRNFLDALPFLPTNPDAHLAVSNTTVRNCRYGIDVQGLASGVSSAAVVSDCRLENLGDAIYVSGVGGALAVVNNSTVTNCDTAMHIAKTGTVVVNNCKFQFIDSLTQGQGPNGVAVTYGNNSLVQVGNASFGGQLDLH